nr:hypothetical protein [Mucilaginibacter humi]
MAIIKSETFGQMLRHPVIIMVKLVKISATIFTDQLNEKKFAWRQVIVALLRCKQPPVRDGRLTIFISATQPRWMARIDHITGITIFNIKGSMPIYIA